MSLPHWKYHNVNYPKLKDGGKWRYAHLVVAERALGKPLPKGAQIHHVDENPKNFSNGNLVICHDMGYHKLLHLRTAVVRAGGNPNTDLFCQGCKTPKPIDEFYPHPDHFSGRMSRCKPCHRQYQRDLKAVIVGKRNWSAA